MEHNEHNHGGLVQIIVLSKWVICRFQPLIFQGAESSIPQWRPRPRSTVAAFPSPVGVRMGEGAKCQVVCCVHRKQKLDKWAM